MKSKNSTSAELTEKQLESRVLYQGRSFSFMTDRVLLPDGREAVKDYVKYPAAVAVIPFLDKDTILLIRQHRYPIHADILEIPAGKLDQPGEDPLEAARRELLEETGYYSKNIKKLYTYYPCGAYSTEKIHVFTATGLTPGSTDPDEDEFIENVPLPFNDALEMVKNGRIMDAKTMLSLLYADNYLRNKQL